MHSAWNQLSSDDLILEQFVAFEKEISIIIARDTNHKTKAYQAAENNHVNHILDTTKVPADITGKTASMAANIGLKLAESLDLIGLLAVEMFVMRDGTVVMNEIAPRPHNSGHWTQDGAQTSQFEQFVRAITGQPLEGGGDLGQVPTDEDPDDSAGKLTDAEFQKDVKSAEI